MTNILVKNQSNENFLKKTENYIFNFILITFFKIKKSKGKMQKRASDSKKILPILTQLFQTPKKLTLKII
jgi:hypothetical protein